MFAPSSRARVWGTTETKQNPQILILKYGQKRIMVKRQRSYNVGGTTVQIFHASLVDGISSCLTPSANISQAFRET
jgi:hypothetical protein